MPRVSKAAMILSFALLSQGAAHAQTDLFAKERALMVESQLKARGIKDPDVLGAMGRVQRHLFVLPRHTKDAYSDYPLPIGEGQTISQPYVVALMTELIRIRPGQRVLEIGTGSGYQAAVLRELGAEVYTMEIKKGLAEKAGDTLRKNGYADVKVRHGDGYFGWEEHAPFDAIMVTAAANHIPPPLIKQLKEGARLVIPLGSTLYFQTLTRVTKTRGELDVEQISGVRFVPMTGEAQK